MIQQPSCEVASSNKSSELLRERLGGAELILSESHFFVVVCRHSALRALCLVHKLLDLGDLCFVRARLLEALYRSRFGAFRLREKTLALPKHAYSLRSQGPETRALPLERGSEGRAFAVALQQGSFVDAEGRLQLLGPGSRLFRAFALLA